MGQRIDSFILYQENIFAYVEILLYVLQNNSSIFNQCTERTKKLLASLLLSCWEYLHQDFIFRYCRFSLKAQNPTPQHLVKDKPISSLSLITMCVLLK